MPFHVRTRADDADKHELDVNCIIFHKGKLYSAGDDGKIKVWAPDLSFIAEAKAHTCSVFCLAASDDTLYSCSNDGSIKAWELSTLKPKATIKSDSGVEFWTMRWSNGVLYVGDDQGNINIFKNEKHYGSINVAEPVKDMALSKNLLFTVKDNDVVVTSLNLEGEKIQFGIKSTVMGRAPIAVVKDTVVFIDRGGKEIVVDKLEGEGKLKPIAEVKDAHSMIINAVIDVNWDGQNTIFTGGWDKVVKKWKVEDHGLKAEGSCNVDIVVTTLAAGEKGELYAAGGDGHIVCLEV